jgi:hypothetical protein
MPEPRCELTELLVSGCAHCRADTESIELFGQTRPIRTDTIRPEIVRHSTRARYDSTCPECRGPVRKGELIFKGDPGWVCEGCVE